MYLNYREMIDALAAVRAYLHVLDFTNDAGVVYKSWLELERIAHRQSQGIKYGIWSEEVKSVKDNKARG